MVDRSEHGVTSCAPHRIAACPACRADAVAHAYRVRDSCFGRCRTCGSLFVEEAPDDDEVAALYTGATYFANPEFGDPSGGGYHGYRDYLADRHEIEAKFASVLAKIETEVGTGKLLDVGSGPGFLLAAARARGWEAVGLEPNEWAAAYARNEIGVDVRTSTLAEADIEQESFDAVTLMDVIEHVRDPDTLVEQSADMLRHGGVLAVLTPDAGSPVSRVLGQRWPEVQRVPEHLVLYSARGLGVLLRRHGFEVVGWHPIGKRSTVATLLADVSPIAPGLGRLAQRLAERIGLAGRSFELDPRTKLVLYARKSGVAGSAPPRRERRLSKARPVAAAAASVEQAVLEDLNLLASARHLCDWMFDQFEVPNGGRVVEVGAGIGTFSARLLDAGAAELLLVEPEPLSADELERRFAGNSKVRVVRELLPNAATLRAEAGTFDLVLCQNVLEHVENDGAAVTAMAGALRPHGRLSLLVPAHPRLYGRLDTEYGHYRRYTRERVQRLMADAGLELERLYSFNLLGVPGWWVSSRRSTGRIDGRAIAVYDLLVPLWRPVETRLKSPIGLSIVAHASKPL
jgi:2-polyprenyl-3-methyl-5-hydroxy-6-metoxy-1,4-benzoquinol methylase